MSFSSLWIADSVWWGARGGGHGESCAGPSGFALACTLRGRPFRNPDGWIYPVVGEQPQGRGLLDPLPSCQIAVWPGPPPLPSLGLNGLSVNWKQQTRWSPDFTDSQVLGQSVTFLGLLSKVRNSVRSDVGKKTKFPNTPFNCERLSSWLERRHRKAV